MAKDEKLGGLLSVSRKTEQGRTETLTYTGPVDEFPADNSDLDEGRIIANGVGLRYGELLALDQIGTKYDLARNALIRFAVRRFILAWRAGEIDLEKSAEVKEPVRQPRRRLKMPKG